MKWNKIWKEFLSVSHERYERYGAIEQHIATADLNCDCFNLINSTSNCVLFVSCWPLSASHSVYESCLLAVLCCLFLSVDHFRSVNSWHDIQLPHLNSLSISCVRFYLQPCFSFLAFSILLLFRFISFLWCNFISFLISRICDFLYCIQLHVCWLLSCWDASFSAASEILNSFELWF